MPSLLTIWTAVGRWKYIATSLVAVVLLCFVGEDCVVARLQRKSEITHLRKRYQTLRAEFVADSTSLARLEQLPEEAEAVARETYHMKRESEDLFIFVEERFPNDSLR